MPHRPWFAFYPSDWRGDVKLRTCSALARLLWLEMLCLMHEGSPYGHLTWTGAPVTTGQLAGLADISEGKVRKLLEELEAAGVFSRTAGGVIYSRRMVRDEEVRLRRAAGGVESLKNPKVPRPKDIHEGCPQGRPQGRPQIPEAISQSPEVTAAAARRVNALPGKSVTASAYVAKCIAVANSALDERPEGTPRPIEATETEAAIAGAWERDGLPLDLVCRVIFDRTTRASLAPRTLRYFDVAVREEAASPPRERVPPPSEPATPTRPLRDAVMT